MAIVFAGAVPAMTQQLIGLPDLTQTLTDAVTDTAGTLLGGTQDLLNGLTATTLTGVVADASCFLTRGKTAMGAGSHEKCAVVCAQRGNRLALVTAKGDVYMIVGTLAQNNNAGLLQFVNKTVVMTGQVSQVAIIVPDVVTKGGKTDNRRPTGTEDGIAVLVKKGDARQGDNYAGTETVLDAATIVLTKPISPGP
jgi:hypothetical protein